MKYSSHVRGIFEGKHNSKQAIYDGILVMAAVIIILGLTTNIIFYALSVYYRGDIPIGSLGLISTFESYTPYLGPLLSLLITISVIFFRFKKTPEYALIQSQYISITVGIFALIGYFYFQVVHIILSPIWIITSLGMVILTFLAAIYGRRFSKLNNKALLQNILSERECELSRLVQKGYSNKEIAQMLYISEETVKTHLKNIFKKLEISKRYELICLAQNTTPKSNEKTKQ